MAREAVALLWPTVSRGGLGITAWNTQQSNATIVITGFSVVVLMKWHEDGFLLLLRNLFAPPYFSE